MADLALNAQPRSVVGKKVRSLRRGGVLPAVVYGPALAEPRSVQLDYKAFETVYREAGLDNPLTLTIGDEAGTTVVVKDVQYNLLKRRIDHVDFYAAR